MCIARWRAQIHKGLTRDLLGRGKQWALRAPGGTWFAHCLGVTGLCLFWVPRLGAVKCQRFRNSQSKIFESLKCSTRLKCIAHTSKGQFAIQEHSNQSMACGSGLYCSLQQLLSAIGNEGKLMTILVVSARDLQGWAPLGFDLNTQKTSAHTLHF